MTPKCIEGLPFSFRSFVTKPLGAMTPVRFFIPLMLRNRSRMQVKSDSCIWGVSPARAETASERVEGNAALVVDGADGVFETFVAVRACCAGPFATVEFAGSGVVFV